MAGCEHAATLEGITNIVTNAGTFEVFDGATAVLDGTINNTGTFLLNGSSSSTLLDVSGPTHAATLTGGGTVTLSNSANKTRLLAVPTGLERDLGQVIFERSEPRGDVRRNSSLGPFIAGIS
jgi:hypothetical protein